MENNLPEVRRQEQLTAPDNQRSMTLSNLKNPSNSVIENGVNALALVDSEPLSAGEFARTKLLLQENYGASYSKERFSMLWELMVDEEWTQYRFDRTLKWFLKNKPYPAWTAADWFQYGVKLYPYEWTLDKNGDYEAYELPDGVIAYKPKDGQTLPFPQAKFHCLTCEKSFTRSSGHAFNRCEG